MLQTQKETEKKRVKKKTIHVRENKRNMEVNDLIIIWKKMSRLMSKQTMWPVRPAKTQISLGIRPVWSVFAVRLKKAWVLRNPLRAQIRLGGYLAHMHYAIWVFAGRTSHFVGFVMRRLKCISARFVLFTLRRMKRKRLSEPRHEKTCLRDFRPGKTQTGLLSYRDLLEA